MQLQALGSPGWEQSAPADLRHEHRQPDLANEGGLAAHVGAGDEVEPGLQRGQAQAAAAAAWDAKAGAGHDATGHRCASRQMRGVQVRAILSGLGACDVCLSDHCKGLA